MTILLIIVAIIASIVLVVLAIATVLPALTEAMERVRIEREAAEASWEIHDRATRAFGQMLNAAREAERGKRS